MGVRCQEDGLGLNGSFCFPLFFLLALLVLATQMPIMMERSHVTHLTTSYYCSQRKSPVNPNMFQRAVNSHSNSLQTNQNQKLKLKPQKIVDPIRRLSKMIKYQMPTPFSLFYSPISSQSKPENFSSPMILLTRR